MRSYLLGMNKVFFFLNSLKQNNTTPSVIAMLIHSMKGGVKCLPNLILMRIIGTLGAGV